MDLQELDGVGAATEERIKSAGAKDVEELAGMDTETLVNAGLSESKAATLVSRAERETVVLQSGAEVRDEVAEKATISTGMDALDDILGGGFREGHIAGVSGESSSGKTQVAFRAIGAAIEQTGAPAVYIETERERFDPDRITELSDLDRETVDEKVWRAKAYSLDQQREAYEAIVDSFDEVSIVVVDSFTARFRLAEMFEGRAGLTDRNSAMVRHLNGIERMVDRLECPALLTLQVMGNPKRFGGSNSTWGGSLMDHTVTYTIKMSHAQGSFRKAQLSGHPSESDGEVLVTISNDGLYAHEDE